ncbi:transmembrane protein [Cystoisospora suis]|uniref:Transmembrane protein n=1 Tax=Cystoisospora suis TaxID=483139 RepID=A0A2C6L5A2_9APIC|nr:transmembrane protein [Cystoisospora suis]
MERAQQLFWGEEEISAHKRSPSFARLSSLYSHSFGSRIGLAFSYFFPSSGLVSELSSNSRVMAPAEAEARSGSQSSGAWGRAEAHGDESKAGSLGGERAGIRGDEKQLGCSAGHQHAGEQESAFFGSHEVETVGQDDVCGFSEGSQNSFDVLSSNVEGDDSEDDDEDDEEEEPSPRSPFGEFKTRSDSGFDLNGNVFVRGPSACLTYRIPCDGQSRSLSSSGHLGESVKSLSPLDPADASSLVGIQTVDEHTVEQSGRSAGEHVGTTMLPTRCTRPEACYTSGSLGALAGAGNSGTAVRASRLQAARSFEENAASERNTERSLVPSANLNTMGHASGSDISVVGHAGSAAVISNGSPVLKLSLALGVEAAVLGETKTGPSQGAERSSDGDQQPAVRGAFAGREGDGLLHRGVLAEGEARTPGSRAVSVFSSSPLADSPNAQTSGAGLCVSGFSAVVGLGSCRPSQVETSCQVSAPASTDCGVDGPGHMQNTGKVRENEAEKKADGETEGGNKEGAESELQEEGRRDTHSDAQKGKAEELWMVNEGQSYCLVSSATHSQEEDSERTHGRLIVSEDVRSEVQRLQRALDQLKFETTGELTRLQRKNADLETVVHSLASGACIPVLPPPSPLGLPPASVPAPSSASTSVFLVSGRKTPSNEVEQLKEEDDGGAGVRAPVQERRAEGSSECLTGSSHTGTVTSFTKTDAVAANGKADEEGFFETSFEEEGKRCKPDVACNLVDAEEMSCAAVLLGRVGADGGFFSHFRLRRTEKKKTKSDEERGTKEPSMVGESDMTVTPKGMAHVRRPRVDEVFHCEDTKETGQQGTGDGKGLEESRQGDSQLFADDAYAFVGDSDRGNRSERTVAEPEQAVTPAGTEGSLFFDNAKRSVLQGTQTVCACTVRDDEDKGTTESDIETSEDEESPGDPQGDGSDRTFRTPSWFSDAWPFLRPLCYPVRALARLLGLNVNGAFDRWRGEVQSQSVRGAVVLGVLDATVCVGLVVGLVYLSLFVSRVLFKTVYVHVHSIENEKVQHYFEGLTYKFWGKKPMYFSDAQESADGRWVAQRVNWYRSSQGYYY